MSITIAFWKPYDVLSKFTDGDARSTLADFIDVPDLYGAGRLDKDSEGLLILSQDPAFRGALTDPHHHVSRRYLAQVEGIPDAAAIEALRTGVTIKGIPTRPATVELVDAPDLPARSVPIRARKSVPDRWLEIALTEGRNRQVRRMTAAVGHPTLRLVRVGFGPITLDGLTPGTWRRLRDEEVTALRRDVGDRPSGPPRSRPRRR